MKTAENIYIHPHALCESEDVGAGTRIWAFAHIMKDVHIGRACNIGGHTFVESGAWLGDKITVKNQVLIWDGITIEDEAFIGPGVIFSNDIYPRSARMETVPEVAGRYQTKENWLSRTRVGQGVSIGAGAIILPGITLGAFAMIAAGAVVSKEVAPQRLIIGNPGCECGWVCLCGRRLNKTQGRWTCEACGRGYCEQGEKLLLSEDKYKVVQ